MPTVLRAGGFSFSFFAGDHEPAHVHARNSDGVVIVLIGTGEVRQALGSIRDRDIKRAKALVAEHRAYLQRAWDEHVRGEG